jgi:hypothetical protein
MIKTANFKFYRTNESVEFFTTLAKICVQSQPEQLNIKSQSDDINYHANKLNDNFKNQRGSSITAELMDIDSRRDNGFTCLSTITEGYEYHHDPQKQEAAKSIEAIIDKYGSNITRLNYQAQSGTVRNLVEELQINAGDKLGTLGIADVVAELDEINQLFIQRFEDRMKEYALDDTVALGELIKEAIISFRQLTSHIVAHATLNPSESYSNLIKQINELIDTYNNSVKQRSRNSETMA